MKTINLPAGSAEWIKSRSASKAAAMMGDDPKTSRTDLIRMMATGLGKEFTEWQQKNLLDKGNATEGGTRDIAEDVIGDGLSPACASTDDGYLTAAPDGVTFDGRIGFEAKTWNEKLAAAVRAQELPKSHHWQLDQQILVFGLEYVLFCVSDGTRENFVSMEYRSTPERAAALMAGWKQLDADIAAYVPSDIKEMPKAAVVVDLPALFVHAKGEITTHNMDEFGKALALRLAETRAIVLVTDQDFSNAKESARKFRETAKAIAISKDAMLAQTETIGDAARKMDAWAKDLNATALQLEKDVEREDKAKKEVMVLGGRDTYAAHVAELEREIAPIRLNLTAPNFAEAIKGKRNYASMQDAVDTMLAGAKVTADAAAKDVRAKLAWCKEHAAGQSALFHDLQQIIVKPMDDFALTITSRIEKAKADEAARLDAEREKIRAEEERKAREKAQEEFNLQQGEAEAKAVAEALTAERAKSQNTPPPEPAIAPATRIAETPAPGKRETAPVQPAHTGITGSARLLDRLDDLARQMTEAELSDLCIHAAHMLENRRAAA
jgi:predicted phage-related endonuclease